MDFNNNISIPLVSILMTSYNRQTYIGAAIESALASSYTNFELIIVDDMSADNSLDIAKEYASKDSRIHVYQNQHNLGDYPNRNRAASYAKGKYLKYLDADDLIYKHSLQYMVECMEAFPDVALGVSLNFLDTTIPYPHKCYPKDIFHEEFLSEGILGIGPSSTIIRKESFEAIGGFSGKQFIGDYELWAKMALRFPLLKFPPALIWWRQHSGQQIVKEQQNLDILDVRYQLRLKNLIKARDVFTVKEYRYALKKIKRNHSRKLLKLISEGRIKDGFLLWKKSGLNVPELFGGFLGYIN